MRKTCFSLSFLLLSYLLMPAVAYSQPGDFKWSRGPNHLYQVSKWDAAKRVKKIGFINNAGKLVIDYDRLPSSTHLVGEFHEGRAVIYLNPEGQPGVTGYHVGFIDESGNMIIPPRFYAARNFSEGLAYVTGTEFRGFIDLQGNPVIKTDDETRDFHEGLAAVASPGRGWGYIDRSGKLVIQKQYGFSDDFSEGLAGVVVRNKFGFINQKGENGYCAALHAAPGSLCLEWHRRYQPFLGRSGTCQHRASVWAIRSLWLHQPERRFRHPNPVPYSTTLLRRIGAGGQDGPPNKRRNGSRMDRQIRKLDSHRGAKPCSFECVSKIFHGPQRIWRLAIFGRTGALLPLLRR